MFDFELVFASPHLGRRERGRMKNGLGWDEFSTDLKRMNGWVSPRGGEE